MRLMRRTRWRLALRASLLVMAVLAVLSTGAYLVARGVLYGRLHDTLEQARVGGTAAVQVEGGLVASSVVPAQVRDTDGFEVTTDPQYGALAILRWQSRTGAWRVLALPAVADVQALGTFLIILVGLTLAGGLAALPAGYLLAARALRPLDDAVRERAEFVALASHRLRTPLSVIRTSAELALKGQGIDPPEALSTIVEQTGEMEALADRLTALARAEALPPGGRPAGADLAAVVAGAADSFRQAAAQAGVELRVRARGPLPVSAPAGELADVLASLLENAIRFSPAGGAVTLEGRAAGRLVVAEVADQGPGIDPADLPHVLRPFYQGRRARGSSGLGLAVARAIVDRHGGRLEIASPPGGGTRVRVLLPAAGRRGP